MQKFTKIQPWVVIIVTFLIIPQLPTIAKGYQGKREPYWLELDNWSACSTTCGPGFQTKLVTCARQSIYRNSPEHLKTDSLCLNSATNTRPQTRQPCNLGDCNMRYIWEPLAWGPCSQTCGGSGLKKRDIICNYLPQHGEISGDVPGEKSLTDSQNCEQSKKPEDTERCNVLSCPPEWVPGKWGKCAKPRSACGKGIQKRSIRCKIVLENNRIEKSTLLMCYKMMRRSVKKHVKVPNWRFCHYADTNLTACANIVRQPPEFTISDLTVVQMRKAKRLRLQIGQKAYVIPWTRVIVKCPVMNFRSRNIVWKHGTQAFKYLGRGGRKMRVKVDKRGRLRIKRFQATDQGEWFCTAGSVQSSILMKMRAPSAGFQDWARRNSARNQEMVNEDPKRMLEKADVVQWVQGDWTRCSRTCGGVGVQTRSVRCERLDTRFYHILTDSVCSGKMLPKPETKRECQSPKKCPEWILSKDSDPNVCTDRCVEINKGTVKGNLTCFMQGKDWPHSACDITKKPSIECFNANCQVRWKTSPWSMCSRSCGGQGITARHLSCVWNTMETPAGSVCYDTGIPVPEVIKSCDSPPCRLKCVDLSKHCGQNKSLCRYNTYRHQCCKSCEGM